MLRIASWIGISVLSMGLARAGAASPALEQAGQRARIGAEARREATTMLRERSQAFNEASSRAQEVSARIAALAADPALSGSSEGESLMRELLVELQDLNDRVQRLQSDVEEIKGWIEGQQETLPILQSAVNDLQRFRPNFYIQFQYRDSNERTASGEATPSQHAWVFRRIRFGFQYIVDAKSSVRMSFDAATGNGNDALQLRDAVMQHTLRTAKKGVGTELVAGQMMIPLGNELDRSSAALEFPEPARYNRVLFNGERTRLVMLRHGVAPHWVAFAAMSSALTNLDPEQVNTASGRFGRHAVLGGIRYERGAQSFGLATLQGERPSLTGDARSAAVYRNFTYLDGRWNSFLLPGLDARGEVMWGNDRIPSATAGPSAFGVPMRGFQAQLLYNLDARNQVFWRHAEFDHNARLAGNTVRETGLGYRYRVSSGVWVTFTYEWFRDPSLTFDPSYQVATLRYQIRF